jgi:dolichol-phosphate mannosyltransferase
MIKIAIVIPCFKVKNKINNLIRRLPVAKIDKIYLVDDCCPDKSLENLHISNKILADKIKIIKNTENLGVGGATKRGYKQAIIDDQNIVIKMDGDGQMDPANINALIKPIVENDSDYTKGNRFYSIENLNNMPKVRIFGNTALSFLSKISSGYWSIFDPTNGYTAINCKLLKLLPLDKISNRYFFENDMLFRLNTFKAKVKDIPMKAIYEDEKSNLKISKVILEFLSKLTKNFFKRIFYNYYLRGITLGSFTLPISIIFLYNGLINGFFKWKEALITNIETPTGTIMVYILSIVLGVQLLLSFLENDINSEPRESIGKYLN